MINFLSILELTLPFFAVVGLGYGAARTKVIDPKSAGSINVFVFYFAMPALVIGALARQEISAILLAVSRSLACRNADIICARNAALQSVVQSLAQGNGAVWPGLGHCEYRLSGNSHCGSHIRPRRRSSFCRRIDYRFDDHDPFVDHDH